MSTLVIRDIDSGGFQGNTRENFFGTINSLTCLVRVLGTWIYVQRESGGRHHSLSESDRLQGILNV